MGSRLTNAIQAIIIASFVLFSVFVYICYHEYIRPLAIRPNQARTVKVPPHTTIHQLADILYKQGLVHHPEFLVMLIRMQGDERELQYGEYRLHSGMNLAQLLSNIINGRDLAYHEVTFIEGWTFQEMLAALKNDKNVKHTLAQLSTPQILAKLHITQKSPEGLFFPDTYKFAWLLSDIDILAMARQRMQQVLARDWQGRAKNLPYKTPYQALIVASLIETETSIADERPIIAGVILARWQKNMRLQIDPTVLYGREKPYGSTITRQDLDNDNVYNTYKNYGLPPTPIAMPGQAAIHAALHPVDKGYLYYVARGDGGHVFSKTYAEHLRAVKRYQRREQDIIKIEEVSTRLFWHYVLQLHDVLFSSRLHAHRMKRVVH